jgi:iron complex outermembrane recepter protein
MYSQCYLNISGQVIDKDDGQELRDCYISLNGTVTVLTDQHGRFVFKDLCSGTHSLFVQHIGCRDTSFLISMTDNYSLRLRLPHSAFELDEIDVMDRRTEIKKTETVSRLDSKELQAVSGQPLGEVLKGIPGVTSLNTGGTISKPMIHGMQGYRLLILNNGIRQEGQQWGNEHAPEIDPFMAKRISVIKGASSIRYGSDAIAGVILVEPNALPDSAAVTGEANLAGFSNAKAGAASLLLEGYLDKMKNFSWRVQGSSRKSGNVKTPQYYLRNTGVEEYNFSYALGYHKKIWGVEIYYSQFNSAIGIFRGSHVSNLTDLAAAYSRSKPADSLAPFSYAVERPYQEVTHELIKGSAHYHFSTRWRARLQYAWQYNWRKEFDLHLPKSEEKRALLENIPQVDYRITSQTIEGIVEHDNIRSFRGMYGAGYMNQKNVYEGRFFIPFYRNNTWGLFATERYVRQHFEIEGGLRYDEKYLQSFFYRDNVYLTPSLTFKNFTWNGGCIWKPDSAFHLFFNSGSAWRSPAPNELYSDGIHHGTSSIEKGSEKLNSEKVYNATLTGILKRKKIEAEITGYHNHFENYIFLNPTGLNELTIRGAFPVFNYEQARVRISGFDAKLAFYAGRHVELSCNAMLVRGWNYTADDYLILMPADRLNAALKYKFGLNNIFTENFIRANNTWVAKQHRVPLSGDFAPAPAAYSLLGFDLGTTLKFGRQKVNLLFSVTNVLNQKYREYLDRFRYFADAAGVSYNIRLSVPFTIYDKK